MARREFTWTDRFFNAMAAKPGWGFAFLLLYGLWLVGAGIWGAIWERRLMTRQLP